MPLIQKLGDPSEQVCWEAAKALGTIGDPAAANALVATMEHDSPDVRWVAADALIELGSEGLRQTLTALLTNSTSLRLRNSAQHVVAHFAHQLQTQFLKPLAARFSGFEPAATIPPAAYDALEELNRNAKLPQYPHSARAANTAYF